MSEPDAEVIAMPRFITPEFNQAEEVVNDLTQQIADQAKTISILKAQVKQLDGIIKANAKALGLKVAEDGTISPDVPPPNRATRRAASRSKS